MGKNKKKKGLNTGSDFEEHRKKVGRELYSKGKKAISTSREAVRKEIREIVSEAKQKKDELKRKVSHAAKNGIKDLKIDGNKLMDILKGVKFKESPSKANTNPEPNVVRNIPTSSYVTPVEKARVERKDKHSYYDVWFKLIESEINEFIPKVSNPESDVVDNTEEIQGNKEIKENDHTGEKALKKINVDVAYLPSISSGTYKKTYELLSKGMSPEEIASFRSLTEQTIYTHIAYFIEKGFLDVLDFISQSTYDEIKDCVKQVGIEHLSDIKELCNDGVSYDDIKMVIAGLKHRNIIEHDDETSKTDSEWHFIKEVSFIKSSKYFLSYQCRVVLSELGYYLEINDGYIKLGDYPKGFSHDDGNIWIKKPIIDKGYRMVHDIQVNSHLIGYIREETNKIVYTNPENEEYTINFS